MSSLVPLQWRSSILVLFIFFTSCLAQGSRRFLWKFNGPNGFSTSLPTCQSIPILVEPWNATDPSLINVTGVPPYFMMAFPTTGTPRIYPIGTDPKNLSWTVDFPSTTELALSVIDSNNTAGGVPSDTFKVVAGQNEGCVVQPPANSFKLTTNVTGTIETCAPWGITLTGGVPPYNWTLAQIKSPVVTNVTGTQADDELVYIMRGDADQRLFVAASDATGKWAEGVGIVTPHNPNADGNVDCIGLRTVTGNSTVFKAQLDESNAKKAKDDRNKTIAIAVPVSIVGALLLAGLIWFFWRRHRKQEELRASAFYHTEPNIESLTPHQPTFTPYTDYVQTPAGTALTFNGTPSVTGASTSPPNTSSVGARKAAEAHGLRPNHFSNDYSRHSHTASVTSGPSSPGPSSSRFLEEDEIVIQHTDGGVVRELPPPYADRTGGGNRPRDVKMSSQN